MIKGIIQNDGLKESLGIKIQPLNVRRNDNEKETQSKGKKRFTTAPVD